MSESRIFRKMTPEEVPQLFRLVQERIEWMNEKGIRQWNVLKYDEIYPLSYYQEEQRQGHLFALLDAADGRVLSGGILRETDERWPDDVPALYLHSFVSKPGAPGAGAAFLSHVESLSRAMDKRCLRLDSACDNAPLGRYYESLGFAAVGECEDGPYRGTLRQKQL